MMCVTSGTNDIRVQLVTAYRSPSFGKAEVAFLFFKNRIVRSHDPRAIMLLKKNVPAPRPLTPRACMKRKCFAALPGGQREGGHW